MQLTTTKQCGDPDCNADPDYCASVSTLELSDDEVRRLIRIGESWGKGLHYPGKLTREVAVELVETLKGVE